MWNSKIFPCPARPSSSQQLQVSNWEPNTILLVPVSDSRDRYNANCSEETADGILRFSDASGQASSWHGLSPRPVPYTHAEWELWALLEEWIKGTRNDQSIQSTSGNSLTKPRENSCTISLSALWCQHGVCFLDLEGTAYTLMWSHIMILGFFLLWRHAEWSCQHAQ